MAKGRSLNPADAYRKSQRKRELLKQKEQRQQARDASLAKRDPAKLQKEISRLESNGQSLTGYDQERLKKLQADVKRIEKAKKSQGNDVEAAIAARQQHQQSVAEASSRPTKRKRVASKKDTEPETDPNLPVIEFPEEERGNGSDDQDNIPLPSEPHSEASDEEDSDEDIPLPQGPPPSRPFQHQVDYVKQAQITPMHPPPPPPGRPPMVGGRVPPPPPPRPRSSHNYPPYHHGAVPPPPPPQPVPFHHYPQAMPSYAGYHAPLHHGAFPLQNTSTPYRPPVPAPQLSAAPVHYNPTVESQPVTYESSDKQSSTPPATVSLSPKEQSKVFEAATISAEPQMRDLRKELVGLVPASVRRKQKPANPVPPKDSSPTDDHPAT